MKKSYFDGKSFESMGIVVERVHDDLPQMREEMEPRPGRHGSYVRDLHLNPREITLECRHTDGEWVDFDRLMEDVAAWLVTEDERELRLRNHPGQHYMAHYTSITEGDRVGGTGIGGFEIAFTAADPIRYGESRSFVLSGSAQRHFDVGGTDESDMVITVRGAVRNASSKSWGMVVNGTNVRVPLANSSQHVIVLDCMSRTVTVDGSVSGLTLDSDWPRFTPGRFRCRIDQGMGTATFSWVQRYR